MSSGQDGSNPEVKGSDILGLSDEDFASGKWDEIVDEDVSTEEDTDVVDEDEATTEDNDDNESDSDDEASDEDDQDDDLEEDSEDDEDGESEAEEDDETDSDDEDAEDDNQEEETTDEDKSDAQKQLDVLFAPFKANGTTMQVKSVEEAIQLMQMGVGFQSKMAALKPNRKLMQMLGKEDLLDESKLSFLIDLHKKDTNAITKLIKEAGLDPLNLNLDAANGYKPNTYTVSDNELQLQDTLDSVSDTEAGQKTLDVLNNKWDEDSRRFIVSDPRYITVMSQHMENGTYAAISEEMTRLRNLGQLVGFSDIAAYKAVGDALHAQGKLPGSQTNTDTKPEATEEQRKAEEAAKKRKEKKRKAARPQSKTKQKPVEQAPDYLNMSDEEFEKQFKV